MLIVDDDGTLRGLLQRLLNRLGCSVDSAENGRVALEKLGVDEDAKSKPVDGPTTKSSMATAAGALQTSSRYDGQSPHGSSSRVAYRDMTVVFLDNQMPILTGMEMVSILRKAGRRDFVVGLSGDASPTDQERFRQAGADEFVASFSSRPFLTTSYTGCSQNHCSSSKYA